MGQGADEKMSWGTGSVRGVGQCGNRHRPDRAGPRLLDAHGAAEYQLTPAGPETWKPRLRQYLRERRGEGREGLSASDFPPGQSVLIRFPDGSHVLSRFAFAIADEAAGEVAVFTEHCGYHVFPAGDAEVETLQAVGQ